MTVCLSTGKTGYLYSIPGITKDRKQYCCYIKHYDRLPTLHVVYDDNIQWVTLHNI